MLNKLTVFCVMLSVTISAQSFKQIRISNAGFTAVKMLFESGIDLENSISHKDGSIDIIVSPNGFAKLQKLPLEYSVLIEDLVRYYQSRPALTGDESRDILRQSKEKYNVSGFGFGSMGGYYTYAEITANLDSMLAKFPNLITHRFSIGTSTEGRHIWAVKISDNPNANENEPQTYFDGLIHAREPQSMATVMYFMWYLLENYGTDPEVTYLVNEREIFFVPCFNPDGYEYNRLTNPTGGGMFRGNRRNNGNGTYGVDLNRNFGYKWGFDDIGSSPDPGDETYRGPGAFSEPETQSVRNLLNSKRVKTYINYHSYNNSVIYPWGYTNQLTPDSSTYIEYAQYITRFNGYDYGNSSQTLGYVSNGTARDWGYGEETTKGKIFSYTFEVGGSSDGFWPSQSRIFPLAQGNLRPNLFQAWIAGGYVRYYSSEFNRQYFLPGDTADMTIKLQNQGLSAGTDVSVSVESLSPGLFLISGQSSTIPDSIPARSVIASPEPVRFTILPTTLSSVKLKLAINTSVGGITMSTDTISIIVGKPTYLMLDSCNNISTLWTVTNSPVSSPKWEATTSTSHSAPSCYTDSKSGNYVSNSTQTLTLINPVNLTGHPSAKLRFSTKFSIEKKWDCGVVQISTNGGTSWISLAGAYTVSASGSGRQTPAGMPCYDAQVNDWVDEEMDLSPYSGQMIRLRFELRTDGTQNYDGWYLDDIGIVVYTIPQPPVSTWSMALNVKDAGNMSKEMIFGTAVNATNGIDTSLGEITLPPVPPSGIFDSRFELPVSPAEYSIKDFRNDSLTSIDWLLKFQPGTGGYPFTFSWDSASLPQGLFTMKDVITGTIINVNMKYQSSYTISNIGLKALKIEYRKQICRTMTASAGWNLISVPVNASNMGPSSLFPQSNSPAYGFANGYVTVNQLALGQGYWLRFPNTSEVSLCGDPPLGITIPVNAGWNLIGPYINEVPASGITSNPPNIINSAFYSFSAGYVQTTSLKPGRGYWVRVTQAGSLLLPQVPAKTPVLISEASERYMKIADAGNNIAKLYIAGAGKTNEPSDFSQYALPPVPPSGIFDIRYETGNMLECLTPGRKIVINSAEYPIVIEAHGADLKITDAVTSGKLLNTVIKSGSKFTIADPAVNCIYVSEILLPAQFALSQNYPNPFNPETDIEYEIALGNGSLSKNAHVSLKIYDILGREIAKLVDEPQAAGKYSVKWNAARLSSGVYYYELNAGDFRAIKKMILLK